MKISCTKIDVTGDYRSMDEDELLISITGDLCLQSDSGIEQIKFSDAAILWLLKNLNDGFREILTTNNAEYGFYDFYGEYRVILRSQGESGICIHQEPQNTELFVSKDWVSESFPKALHETIETIQYSLSDISKNPDFRSLASMLILRSQA